MTGGRILDEDVRAVRERADLEAIVSEHTTLRVAGVGSLKGLCPFHDEKSPSFQVRPQLGLWHCFGCGEGGDVIAFVQKIDGLGFTDAVEYLANRSGITLRYEEGRGGERRPEDPHRRARLLAVNDAALDYYRAQLLTPEAAVGRGFLSDRGFDHAAADTFGVGYAPQGWTHLRDHLTGRSFTDAELIAAGLVTEGDRGRYDRFRGRLIWPIRDVTGAIVGFGARRLFDDDQGPKYLNTPETALYRKSQVLFGIDLAKRAIAQGHQVVVVEGYTDVMAMHLSGVGTAVATCGTAFGVDHIRLVRRLLGDAAGTSGEVVFCFDGDAAGQKAAVRAFGEDQRFAATTSVAVAPEGQDPCELRMAEGPEAVRALVAGRQPLFAFVIEATLAAHDLSTAEGRVRALRATAPIVAAIRDEALRPEYTRMLADWLRLDPTTVREEVRTALRLEPTSLRFARSTAGDTATSGDTDVPSAPDLTDPTVRAERDGLAAALQHPALAADAGFDDLPDDAFEAPAYRAIHDVIRAVGGTGAVGEDGAAWVQDLADRLPGDQQLPALTTVDLPADDDALPDYVAGMVAALRRSHAGRRIAEIRADLVALSPEDSASAASLLTELVALERVRV